MQVSDVNKVSYLNKVTVQLSKYDAVKQCASQYQDIKTLYSPVPL